MCTEGIYYWLLRKEKRVRGEKEEEIGREGQEARLWGKRLRMI